MGNWFSINQGTPIDFDSEVDGEPSIAVRIPNKSESHEPTIPKQLESSPAEFNERNILEEKKHTLKKTNGHDSCRTYLKKLETSLLSTRQPSPIFRASNDNENIRRERSNSDAANSMPSKNKDGRSFNSNHNSIQGDDNRINGSRNIVGPLIDNPLIDQLFDHHRQRLLRNVWGPWREKMVLEDLRLKGVVSHEAIFEVAQSVGAYWMKLGESLHFSHNELDILDREHKSEGAGEICYLLLENWRETLASEATYWVLRNALNEIGRHDVVEILRSISDD